MTADNIAHVLTTAAHVTAAHVTAAVTATGHAAVSGTRSDRTAARDDAPDSGAGR